MDIWRNVALAAARGLEYTFGAIARAIAGEQPVEASGFSLDLEEPSQSARSGKSSGKKEKKEKKEKRPPNSYNLFVSEQMKVLRKKYPGTPSTDLFRQISQDWKTSAKNKKNRPPRVEAPPDVHLDDIDEEAEAEGLLEGAGQGGEEEGEEVTGKGAEEEEPPKVRLEESTAREKGEKGDKKEKKKKKRIRSQEEEEEVGGTGFHKGLEEEEGTPQHKSSKKGKR